MLPMKHRFARRAGERAGQPQRLDAEKPKDFDAAKFFTEVAQARNALGIAPGKGTERDRRRIAVAITNVFLRVGGMAVLHQAPVFEAQLYTFAHGLVCDPLPEETRVENEPRARGFNVLKLHIDSITLDPALIDHPSPIVRKVLQILRKEEESDGSRPAAVCDRDLADEAPRDYAGKPPPLAYPRTPLH